MTVQQWSVWVACVLVVCGGGAARAQEVVEVPEGGWAVVGSRTITQVEVEEEARWARVPVDLALQGLVLTEVRRQRLVEGGVDLGAVHNTMIDGLVEARLSQLEARGFEAPPGEAIAAWQEQARVEAAFTQHVRSVVTEARAREVFAEHRVRLAGELRLRHILVAYGSGGPAAAAARAQGVLQRLGSSPSDAAFAREARRSSDDPMAALTGGDLDWVRVDGTGYYRIPSTLVGAAFRRGAVGLVPHVVSSELGLHVVWVSAVHDPEQARFEDHAGDAWRLALGLEAERLAQRWMEEARLGFAEGAPWQGP